MEFNSSLPELNLTFVTNQNESENSTTTTSYVELGEFYILIFDGFVLPIVALFGTVGNILSLLVLTRPSMRRSAMNVMLIGLTAFDLIFVISMVGFRSVGREIGKYGLGRLGVAKQDWIFWWDAIFYPLVSISCAGSHLMTVLITMERYVAVCHPLKSSYLCSEGRAKKAVWFAIIFSVVVSLPAAFDPLIEAMGEDVYLLYDIYYTTIWRLVALNLAPFLILILLNIAIYREIRKSIKLQRTMRPTTCKRESINSSKEDENETNSLAFLLFAIVLTFLICKAPQILTDILANLSDKGNSYFVQVYFSPRHFLDTLNSCVNFLFYCFYGKRFRGELANLFNRKVGNGTRSSIVTNNGSKDSCSTEFAENGITISGTLNEAGI